MLASSRSVLTDVAMTGPSHSRNAGIAKPAVLPHPVGPTTARLVWVSAATSRERSVPSVRRPRVGSATMSARSSVRRANPDGSRRATRCSKLRRLRTRTTIGTVTPPAAEQTSSVAVQYPSGPGRKRRADEGHAAAGSPRCSGSRTSATPASASETGTGRWPTSNAPSCAPAQHNPTTPKSANTVRSPYCETGSAPRPFDCGFTGPASGRPCHRRHVRYRRSRARRPRSDRRPSTTPGPEQASATARPPWR